MSVDTFSDTADVFSQRKQVGVERFDLNAQSLDALVAARMVSILRRETHGLKISDTKKLNGRSAAIGAQNDSYVTVCDESHECPFADAIVRDSLALRDMSLHELTPCRHVRTLQSQPIPVSDRSWTGSGPVQDRD